MSVDWILVKRFGNNPIGAVGMVDDKALVIAAFYDDLDGNKDGKVSFGEWVAGKVSPISLKGSAVVEVAVAAKSYMEITDRDPDFRNMSNDMFQHFAQGAILDGIFAAYFARGVSMTGGGLAKLVTSNNIKQMVIKKGFESAVKEAFNSGMGR